MRTPVAFWNPYVTLLRCQIGGAVPEPPEIGLEPHWLSVLDPSMQMPNISGRNKPVPHSGDNTLRHTKDISTMSLG